MKVKALTKKRYETLKSKQSICSKEFGIEAQSITVIYEILEKLWNLKGLEDY